MQKRSFWSVYLVVVLIIVSVTTACSRQSSDENFVTDVNNTNEILTVEELEPVVLTVDGIIEEKNEDQLFQQSSLIVRGTVEESYSFQVESVSGGIGNYTDYVIQVEDVYRGEHVDDSLTVRIQGGTAGGVIEVHTAGPVINYGEEYILFLYQPGRGGSFHTEGEYYYILGLTQGIFSEDEEGIYVPQKGEAISIERIVERANEYPVDLDYFRNEYIENQKQNLQNGFITEDEYIEMMDEVDVYASVITPELEVTQTAGVKKNP